MRGCGMHDGGDGCVSYNLGQVYTQQQLHAAPLYIGVQLLDIETYISGKRN